MNKVENYNTRYKSDYNSAEDNCEAKISNDHADKIAPQNITVMSENNQVTHLLDYDIVCSIITKDLAILIIDNCKDAKWASEIDKTSRIFRINQ